MNIQLTKEQLQHCNKIIEKIGSDQDNISHVTVDLNKDFGIIRYVKAEENSGKTEEQSTPQQTSVDTTAEQPVSDVKSEETNTTQNQQVQPSGTVQSGSPDIAGIISTLKTYLGPNNIQTILNVLDNDLGKFVIKQFTGSDNVDGIIQQVKDAVLAEQTTNSSVGSGQQVAANTKNIIQKEASSQREDKTALIGTAIAVGTAAYALYKYLSRQNVQYRVQAIIDDLLEKGFIQENQVDQYKQFITNFTTQLVAPSIEQQQQQSQQQQTQQQGQPSVKSIAVPSNRGQSTIPQSEYNTMAQPRQSSLSTFEWDFLSRMADQTGQNTISYYLTSGEGRELIDDLIEEMVDDELISEQHQPYYATQLADSLAQTINFGYGQAEFNPLSVLQGFFQWQSGGTENEKENVLNDKSIADGGNLAPEQQSAANQPTQNQTNNNQTNNNQTPVNPSQEQVTPPADQTQADQAQTDRLTQYQQYLPTASTEQLNDYAARGLTPQQAQWEFMQTDPTIQQLNQTSMQQPAAPVDQSTDSAAQQAVPQPAEASFNSEMVKQATFLTALLTWGPIVYSVVSTVLEWLGESDEEVVRTAGIIDKVDKVVNTLHSVLNNDSAVAPLVDKLTTKLNLPNSEQLRPAIVKVLEAISEFTASQVNSPTEHSNESSVEAKINSNTFLLKKGNTTYSELEELLIHVAKENNITDVESVNIVVDPERCTVRYAASSGGFDWINALVSFVGNYAQGAGMGEAAIHGLLNGTAGNFGSTFGGIIGRYFGHEWIGTAVGYVGQNLVSRLVSSDAPDEMYDAIYESATAQTKQVIDILVSQGIDRNTAIKQVLGIGSGLNAMQNNQAGFSQSYPGSFPSAAGPR